MKKHLLVTIVALAATTGMAFAGGSDRLTSQSSSQSLSAATSASNAVAVAQGGNVTFNTPAQTSSRIHQTYGTQTIRSAPQVVAPSMSSGHPCAYAPVSVGVSVVGFGGAFGGQRIDDACLLAQMGVSDASLVMIAQRSPAACQALMATGRIRSCRGAQSATRTVAYRPAAVRTAPRPAVRRATLPPQVVVAPAPRMQMAKPAYRQVKQLKQMGKNCQTVQATASTKKTVCG